MSKPNIFRDYATSELSQDAFICWLLSWADSANQKEEPALNKVGTEMVKQLLTAAGITLPDILRSVKVHRQKSHIDVLAVVNDTIAILVEDKVNTGPHSDQLNRCLQTLVTKGIDGQRFLRENIAPIYLKTGDESDYNFVTQSDFTPFLRRKFIEVLRTGSGVTNAIFCDYLNYIEKIEVEVQGYSSIPITEAWSADNWIGFFLALQKKRATGGWARVNNPARGFMGYWWARQNYPGADADVYLLLEQEHLCFKMDTRNIPLTEALHSWRNMLFEAAGRHSGHEIEKTGRLKSKGNVTVARMKGDYRQHTEKRLLDIEKTIEVLKWAENVLRDSLKHP